MELPYVFFWIVSRRLEFYSQRFGALCLFQLHMPMNMEQTECVETLAFKIRTPGNYPKENI
jgi:hypothetical protein